MQEGTTFTNIIALLGVLGTYVTLVKCHMCVLPVSSESQSLYKLIRKYLEKQASILAMLSIIGVFTTRR